MPSGQFRDHRPYSRSFTPSVVAENSVFEQQESVDGLASASAPAIAAAHVRAPEYIPMEPIAEGRIEAVRNMGSK